MTLRRLRTNIASSVSFSLSVMECDRGGPPYPLSAASDTGSVVDTPCEAVVVEEVGFHAAPADTDSNTESVSEPLDTDPPVTCEGAGDATVSIRTDTDTVTADVVPSAGTVPIRFDCLDGLRGFAAVQVMFYHYKNFWPPYETVKSH
ncbi:hypothetical protein KIPB_014417, partial [Kipferlia bialata]|eukprot:g14417.t1